MKSNLRKSLLALVVAAMVFAALPITSAQDAVESVCLITDVGRVNDGTFNQYAYEGMIEAGEEFDLETNYIETTAATDYAANIGTCVDEEFDVIVTVGFFLQDATLVAATENPEVYFIGVDQAVTDGPANYVGTQFREDQAGFLVGVLAALVTESNIVAGVYGIDIPPVVKFRNGFEQGILYAEANLVDKDVEALGVYIPDFVAPDRGASAAEQFIGEGADVIFGAGGPTGSGGISAAAQQDVWVIGVDQDEYLTTFGGGETPGAEFIISSATKRVDVAVYSMIEALVNGDMETFVGGGTFVFSAENDGVSFAEKHDAEIDDAYYETVAEVLEGLKSGEIETGVDPVSGVLLGAEGEVEATPEATEAP